MRRQISLFAIISFAATLGLFHFGCSGTGRGRLADNWTPDLNNSRLKERLGEDDGYAFAIHYSGDIHGSLETCG